MCPAAYETSRTAVGEFSFSAQAVVVASGGIGGNFDLVRQNWPASWGSPPQHMIAGVPDYVDGSMLEDHRGRGWTGDQSRSHVALSGGNSSTTPRSGATTAFGSSPGHRRCGWMPEGNAFRCRCFLASMRWVPASCDQQRLRLLLVCARPGDAVG